MTQEVFDSYSQNGEDVVLWRALQGIERGRYIDVGANHPEVFSVTMAFYERGWSGITVEPDPEFAQMQRDRRPRDTLFQVAATTQDGDQAKFHLFDGTGLSTLDDSYASRHFETGYDGHDIQVATRTVTSMLEEAGWQGQDIHFMNVDVEGFETEVLAGTDFSVWRPWVLVVEATVPLSTVSTRDAIESLLAQEGYRFCLFDGLSCFFVAEERAEQLEPKLSYPACILDNYHSFLFRQCLEKAEMVPSLMDDVVRWRSQALTRWADAMADEGGWERRYRDLQKQHESTLKQLDEVFRTKSWRITRPLRAVQELRMKRARPQL